MDTTRNGNPRTLISLTILASTLALATGPARAAEDSLVCARVNDAYADAGYQAAFWPRSAAYGEMAWCDMEVKAVEHCVPVEPVLHETDAPFVGTMGPELTREYTCYKIRCKNREGTSYLGSSVTIDDTWGTRTGSKPRVSRICVPNQ